MSLSILKGLFPSGRPGLTALKDAFLTRLDLRGCASLNVGLSFSSSPIAFGLSEGRGQLQIQVNDANGNVLLLILRSHHRCHLDCHHMECSSHGNCGLYQQIQEGSNPNHNLCYTNHHFRSKHFPAPEVHRDCPLDNIYIQNIRFSNIGGIELPHQRSTIWTSKFFL